MKRQARLLGLINEKREPIKFVEHRIQSSKTINNDTFASFLLVIYFMATRFLNNVTVSLKSVVGSVSFCDSVLGNGLVLFSILSDRRARNTSSNRSEANRGSQRDVVFLGWPISALVMSPNWGEGGKRGISGVSVNEQPDQPMAGQALLRA